ILKQDIGRTQSVVAADAYYKTAGVGWNPLHLGFHLPSNGSVNCEESGAPFGGNPRPHLLDHIRLIRNIGRIVEDRVSQENDMVHDCPDIPGPYSACARANFERVRWNASSSMKLLV